MFLQKLPDPALAVNTTGVPFFADHLLFTQNVEYKYTYPEHVTGFGIIYTFSGKGIFHVNRERISVQPNAFLVVNQASRLAIDITDADTQPAILYFNSLLPSISAASLANSPEKLLDDPSFAASTDFRFLERLHPMQAHIKYKLLQIVELGSSCASFAALKADMLVRSIVETLLRQNKEAIRLSSNLSVVKYATRIELYKRLSIAREWIDEYYASPITLEDTSRIALLNSQHFLRLFKQVYHITPHRYLIELRLNHARHMLASGKENVANICNTVGFESVSSFSILFKRRFGITPSMYRGLS